MTMLPAFALVVSRSWLTPGTVSRGDEDTKKIRIRASRFGEERIQIEGDAKVRLYVFLFDQLGAVGDTEGQRDLQADASYRDHQLGLENADVAFGRDQPAFRIRYRLLGRCEIAVAGQQIKEPPGV